MATEIIRDQKVWLGGYDFTGVINSVAMNYDAEEQDATVLGNNTRIMKAGLRTLGASVQGFFDAGTIDGALFDRIGAVGDVLTIPPVGEADGSLAYTVPVESASYAPGGAIGELLRFGLDVRAGGANANLVRGTIMHNAARTASGTGTARQLGAVAAGQKLYAALHVLAVSGTTPTLDVVIESDDAGGMATPTTRLTFAQASAIGAQWASPAAGAITDDWFRVNYTIGGTTPSFTFVVVIGIL